MASFDRGTKRQCQNCGTKFYDLNKDPILCPSCGAEFMLVSEPAAPVAAVKEKEAEKPKVEEVETDQAAAEVGAEVISLDDAEEDSDKSDDNIPDVDEVEVDEELGNDDNDVFLEDEDDDDDIKFDVGGDEDDT